MVGTIELAGRYRLEEKIATGGMGTVWRAEDSRLGRTVAVKQLRDSLAGDPTFVERFRREARAVAALSHPNIANVFDYGEDQGKHFIVMEHVPGRDLSRVIREDGPLDSDRATTIAAEVCDALGHAHAAGVIHRDVKPANIIVTDDGRVKVTDFGIARAVGDTTLTAAGSVLGTAHYVSPEQAGGERVGAGSDIYSLGLVLYEMLTGSVPFTGDSPVAVAMRHLSDDVPPPSELQPEVPRHLDDAVARATAKEPTDRFGTAEEMAAALRRTDGGTTAPMAGPAQTAVFDAPVVTEGRPLPLPDRWDPYRVGKIVIGVFLLLALIAGVLLFARLVSDDAEPTRRPGAVNPPPETSPSPSGFLLENVIGANYKQVEDVLKQEGFEVKIEKEHNDDYAKEEIFATRPPPGSTVFPGDTITLFVSEGPEEDDHPGKGPPKDKGKEKDDD